MKKYLLAVVLLSGILNAQQEKIILVKILANANNLSEWRILDRDRDGVYWSWDEGAVLLKEAGFDGDAETYDSVFLYIRPKA